MEGDSSGAQVVVEGVVNKRVCEAIASGGVDHCFEHTRGVRLLESLEHLGQRKATHAREQLQVELAADG